MAFYTINLDLDETYPGLFDCLEDSDTDETKDDVSVDVLIDPDVEFKGKIRNLSRLFKLHWD